MAKKKTRNELSSKERLLFGKENYITMIAGLVLIGIGLIMMSGKENVYSTMKVTVGPILIFVGFMVEIWAILRKSNS